PIDHLWGAVSDAYYYTQSCSSWSDADDPQVNYSASGGPSFALPGNQVQPGRRDAVALRRRRPQLELPRPARLQLQHPHLLPDAARPPLRLVDHGPLP